MQFVSAFAILTLRLADPIDLVKKLDMHIDLLSVERCKQLKGSDAKSRYSVSSRAREREVTWLDKDVFRKSWNAAPNSQQPYFIVPARRAGFTDRTHPPVKFSGTPEQSFKQYK
jgi:hypothetical protein